jgi:hypothetical protein
VRRSLLVLLSLAVPLALAQPAKAERPGWYANPSIAGAAQVGATISGNPGGIKCEPDCQGTAYEWLSCTGPGPAGADRPTGGLPFDGHPAPGCEIRVPFPGSLAYTVRPEDAGRHIQLHLTATNRDCGEVRSDGYQECNSSTGHAYSQTIGPIAGGAPPAPAAPAPPAAPPAPAAPPQPAVPPAVAPVNASRPTITGYAEQNETLTVSAGSWSGTEPISFRYQWFRCARTLGGCRAIDGATGTSYTVVPEDVGTRLTATVTGVSRAGGMPATAPRTEPVLPAAPQPGHRVIDAGKLRANHRLVVARIDGPRAVRARGTATLLIRIADARGFLIKGADVQISGPTGTVTKTSAASGVAVLRVRVGAPRSGRLVLTVTASTTGEVALSAVKRIVLRVRG